MRKILGLAVMLPLFLAAQKPTINSISPRTAEFGEKVTISGSELGGASATVYFGGVRANDVSGDDRIIEVAVPAGAYQGPITVLTNNLVAQSAEHFFISFGGSSAPSFGAESLTDANEQNVFEICTCDLNGDNLNDIIVTHENINNVDDFSEFTYFINNSTPTSTDFGVANEVDLIAPLSTVDGFVSVECADLNNDGSNNVVFIGSESLNAPVFVFEDITVPNPSPTELVLPRTSDDNVRDLRGLQISDIDGDGLKDIIVGNTTDNAIHIYRNLDDFNFATAAEIVIPNAANTGTILVSDFNKDLSPDVAIVPFGSNDGIYFLRNNSLSGSISFLEQDPVNSSDTRRNIQAGDFDNDGLVDFATTADASNANRNGVERVGIFQNTSTSNGPISFSFLENIDIPTELPWGIDLGDLNGDGLLDIVVSCVGISGSGDVYVLENNSTASISFAEPASQGVSEDARNITVADLNGDAKPDLAYSHDISLNSIGDIGVQMNTTCIDPVITPSSFSYCSGEDFTLEATNTPNGVYNWTVSPAGVSPSISGNQATFNIVSSDDQTIEVEVTQAGCTTPITEMITIDVAVVSTPLPTIQVNDINGGAALCEGETVTLSTTDSFESYRWTLPDGSSITEATISIEEVSSSDAGTYSLTVKNDGSCSSQEATNSVIVDVVSPPIIQNDGEVVFCADGTSDPDLEVDLVSGATYEWFLDGATLGETGTSITATASGDYTIAITNSNGCTKESGAISLQAISPPVSIPTGVSATCRDITTSFMASSTGETGFTLEYSWRVDSAGVTLVNSSATDFDYNFTSPTTFDYQVILTTRYASDEVTACEDEATLVVNVSPPPTIVFNQSDGVEKCSAEALDLSISNTNVDSFSWLIRNANTNGSNDTIIVANASVANELSLSTPTGIDSVYAVVEILTSIGCTTKDSILVKNFPSNVDISSQDFSTLLDTDSALLDEAISISLQAVNFVSNFSWEPAEQIDDPTASSITYFPQNPTSIVTLTGVDADGCLVSSAVTIELDNLRPKKTFSPNGDGINDCWEILNIGELGNTPENQCEVFIFDARGRNIDVISNFEAENCVWNGNFGGSPVPEGVYYFILKCSQESFSKTGSILLAR